MASSCRFCKGTVWSTARFSVSVLRRTRASAGRLTAVSWNVTGALPQFKAVMKRSLWSHRRRNANEESVLDRVAYSPCSRALSLTLRSLRVLKKLRSEVRSALRFWERKRERERWMDLLRSNEWQTYNVHLVLYF